MPAEQNPRDGRIERETKGTEQEGMTLTDFFDQMDRAAFRRSLEHRDSVTSDRNDRTVR